MGMNEIIATKLFGLVKHDYIVINGTRYDTEVWLDEGESPDDPRSGRSVYAPCPHYTGDTKLAFKAVDKMLERGWRFSLCKYTDGWHAEFFTNSKMRRSDLDEETREIAICKAIIAALET